MTSSFTRGMTINANTRERALDCAQRAMELLEEVDAAGELALAQDVDRKIELAKAYAATSAAFATITK